VVRLKMTVKTLILEFVVHSGPSHIRQIHLQISQIRPDVPQHTVRARLSEMSRSAGLEERLDSLGGGFYGLYQENNGLCSVVSYPQRGPWGDAQYRGNCSGHLVKDLILRFGCQSVFDPAQGGGTVKDVVSGINKYRRKNIQYTGRDLKQGWDVLKSELPPRQFDMVWYHPPYWDIIAYSCDSRDLSACRTLDEFEDKLNRSTERLYRAVRAGGILAILIGDKRKCGEYFALFRTLLTNHNIGALRAIIIKIQHNCKSQAKNYRSSPFLIPIRHEYCLIFQKPS
jgi:hypothetical protein